ncbi:Imm10 family immunity protein [Xanthomonas campestris]|uniref:Imm10 family immunity protein n=1 Tax=Xanthomonas campestris TaxID=339 RepID=UPI003CEB8B05
MNAFTFEAECVAVEQRDGEFLVVGFADNDLDTGTYLMLQRALEHDEQDSALGMDTFHVEWCGEENSRYGGISRFELRPNSAEVIFEQDSLKWENGLPHLTISFHLDSEEFLVLREALTRIFLGSDCLMATCV